MSEAEHTSEADAAFARMVAAHPGATVLDGPRVPNADDGDAAAADAAFARMVAAHPNATVYDRPRDRATEAASTAEVDEAIARIVAANPAATIIRGPAGGGPPLAAPASGENTWTFSADLTPERRAEIEAMIGIGGPQPEAAADSSAADAAFQAMVDAHPGTVEIAPGVYSTVESPTGDVEGLAGSPPLG